MSNRRQPAGSIAADSSAIIKQGAQGVSSRGKNAEEKSVVPASTLRALQLRNGKGGSFGMGEVMKIPGREKLELIAEDEMAKAKAKEERRRNIFEAGMNSSLKAPFRLETIMKITQSQMDAYIDFINALHKPDLCYDIMIDEIRAQCPPTNGVRDPDLMRIPSFVAEQFGICVHNAHMLASGWVILYESFRKLKDVGLEDREIYMQVQTDAMIRDIYLSAYGLVKKLVNAGQQRLRSIVHNTSHYAPYFKSSTEAIDYQEFERSEVRKMYSSFLDSAIIELCLPGSKFSPQALYFCLHMTSEESPKQLRRCPQLMWDAVGDLAESVRLMDIMEIPLITQAYDLKTEDNSSIFNEFVRWNEAQAISIRSATQYSSYVNLVYPLTNLKNKSALDKTWDLLHANYMRESGQNIDALWQLVDARHRFPHFSTSTISPDILYGASKNGDKALVRAGRNGKRKPIRTIANRRNEEESDSSMPGLLDVSGSEDEDQNTGSDEDDDIHSVLSSEYANTVDDEYDEREEVLKRQEREAIDLLLVNPDSIDLNNDKYANERKQNPLLLLLDNLRGRLFTSSSALRTDGVTNVTSKPTKSQAAKKPLVRSSLGSKASDKSSASLWHEARSTMSTIEDVDDESDEHKGGGDKKKKKKPKKKKKSTTEAAELPKVEAPSSPASEPPRTPSPPPDPEVASLVSSKVLAERTRPAAPKSPSIKTPSIKSNLSGTTASTSTTTLQLPQEQKAPSAHSYLQQINVIKTKTKTRPDQPVEVPPVKERKNLFDKLRGKDVPKETKDKNSADVFKKLKRKTGTFARRLFGVTAQDKKGALKWDQFLQVMRELGFDYDPSTAGSSVRFDPPNPNDRSISFHKPHPDPTLHQNVLKQYRDKLEEYYGWSPEKFQNAVQDIEGMNNEDGDY